MTAAPPIDRFARDLDASSPGTCVVCRARPRQGYSATCSADCLDRGLRGPEDLPAAESRQVVPYTPQPIDGTCVRCGTPLIAPAWHVDSGECITALRQQLADSHNACLALLAEKERTALDELEGRRSALHAAQAACEFGVFFESVMAHVDEARRAFRHERASGEPLAQAITRLVLRAEQAEAEAERLRSVILIGGARYRAERAVLGVPGGIDEDQ